MKWDERLYEPSDEANGEVLKEAYYKLGQLSILFAEMEENVHEIVSGLISDDWVISSYLIDRNFLEKNLQLLEKLNEYRAFEVDKVKEVVRLIYAVKEKRNELIHGVWYVRIMKSDSSPVVFVVSHRMMRPDSIIKGKKSWASRTHKSYNFEEISKTIEEIKGIIVNLKVLTNKLKKIS